MSNLCDAIQLVLPLRERGYRSVAIHSLVSARQMRGSPNGLIQSRLSLAKSRMAKQVPEFARVLGPSIQPGCPVQALPVVGVLLLGTW